MVCIDDFATKKRYTYGTVMVDAETGRIAVPTDTPASSYWQKQPNADDLPGRLHDASTKRRTAAVEKMRELAGQGLSMDQISEATGYCRATVKKYLTPDFEPAYSAYGMNRLSKLRTCLHRPKYRMGEGFFRQTKAIRRRRTEGTSRRIAKVWRKKTRPGGFECL